MAGNNESLSLDELESIMNLQRQEAFDDEGPKSNRGSDAGSKDNKQRGKAGADASESSIEGRNNGRRRRSLGRLGKDGSSADDEKASRSKSAHIRRMSPHLTEMERLGASTSVLNSCSSPRASTSRSATRSTSPRRRSQRQSRTSFESDVSGNRRRSSKSRTEPTSRKSSSQGQSESNGRRSSSTNRQRQSTRQLSSGDRSPTFQDADGDGSESKQSVEKETNVRSRKTAPRRLSSSDKVRNVSSKEPGRKMSEPMRKPPARSSSGSKPRLLSDSGRRKSVAVMDATNLAKEFPGESKSSRNDADSLSKGSDSKASRKSKSSRKKSFDDLWVDAAAGDDMNASVSKGAHDSGNRSQSSLSMPPLPHSDRLVNAEAPTNKKSKLEKIHELQAKYDRYKQEWIQATKEKKQVEKELKLEKLEVVSLTKEIEAHVTETEILQQKLAESIKKSDELAEEQRKERLQFADVAKELAQSRIDFTKSLNESRELRAELDEREHALQEKDKRISSLTAAIERQMDKAEDMEAKLDRAEEEIGVLEDKMNEMEEELIAYRTAASKDDVNGDGHNLKQARDEMERRMTEERERRLNEKQKKLDEKQREFDEEREKHFAEEKKRREEDAQRDLDEQERQKTRDEERQRVDEEINSKLKELEDDNAALQARLKSEQLVSNDKIKKKEESIASLQKDMAELKKEIADRDSDPNSTVSLQKDIESLKTEASSAREDLEEARKLNGMLTEEIEDLQAAKAELKDDVNVLQKEVANWKKQSADWQRKAEEWKNKASEWTEKTFQWKEKAEKWENTVRELDPSRVEGGNESKEGPEAAPQAMFLQAAMVRKKQQTDNAGAAGSGFRMFGGIFNKASDLDETEADARIKELEDTNATQLETIKKLRSEIVNLQAKFKEDAYNNQKKMQQLQDENDAIDLKNTNLLKQLELARRLDSVAAQDDST